MSATVRFYQQRDERRIAAFRPETAAQFDAMAGRVHEGPKWTLQDGDAVLAVGGAAFDETSDSWDLWLLADAGMRPRHWVQVYHRTQGLIQEIKALAAESIWVQADVCAGAKEFIERLGFQRSKVEGVYYV